MQQLDTIPIFLAVAEAGGFRRAADRLGMTSAGVSKAVARLEAELDTRLFERTTRRVDLTPQGVAFRAKAEAAMLAHDEGAQAGLCEVVLHHILWRKRLVQVGGGKNRAVQRVLKPGAAFFRVHHVECDPREDQHAQEAEEGENHQAAAFGACEPGHAGQAAISLRKRTDDGFRGERPARGG